MRGSSYYSVCDKCGKVKFHAAVRSGRMSLGSVRYPDGYFEKQRALADLHAIARNRCRCRVLPDPRLAALEEDDLLVLGDSVSPSPRPVRKTSTSSLAKELLELKNLFDQGVLTREQFERAKNKLLE